MYSRGAEFKAGFVVLLALAGLLTLLYFAGGSEPIWGRYRYVHVRFKPGFVAPTVGDPAFMNGVPVGRVSEVHQREETRGEGSALPLTREDRRRLGLAAGETGTVREVYVLAILKMPKDQECPRGTTAQIDKSLTGIRTLSLLPGVSTENLTDAETRASPIPGAEAPGLTDITASVNALVVKVDALVGSGDEVLTEAKALLLTLRGKIDAFDTVGLDRDARAAVASLRRSLESVEARVDGITTDLQAAAGRVNELTAKGSGAMDDLRADLRDVMAALKQVTAGLDAIVRDAQEPVREILANLKAASRDVSAVSGELSGIGPDARRILADLGVDLDLLMKTLTDTGHNLQDASEDLRTSPWKLLNKPDADEIAFDNLRTASLGYMRAMRDLNEASARLTAVLGRKDLDRPEAQAILGKAVEAFDAALERYRRDEARWQRLFDVAGPRRR